MLLRLYFVVTLLHQGFALQLFLPYNILWLNEILENQKNYVTVQVNLAQAKSCWGYFFGPCWSFLGGLALPTCLTHNMTVLFIFCFASMVGDNSLWYKIIYVAFILRKSKSNSLKKDTDIFSSPGQYNQWECFINISTWIGDTFSRSSVLAYPSSTC